MKKLHYGWVVCITCTLLLFITMGTVSNGFSVYLPYIMDQRGLTHAQTSSLVTLRCLTAFLAMLTIGWYYKKMSLRLGVSIAACCAGISYLLYAVAQTYPAFCVGAELRVRLDDPRLPAHEPLVRPAPGLGPEHLRHGQRHCHHRPASGDDGADQAPVHGSRVPHRGRGDLRPGGADLHLAPQ